jgi:hypothetical protein
LFQKCQWSLFLLSRDNRNCIRLGLQKKHLFECVGEFAATRSNIGLHFRIIEDMFGTKLRIRCSRPSAGCENPVNSYPNSDSEGDEDMSAVTLSAVTLGGFAGYSAPVRQSHLRMTRRGRAVLLTLVAAPVVVVALLFGINAGGATATSSSTPLTKVTVVGGETLWSLAKQISPNTDPRDVVADVMSVNRMDTADIYPGEQLSIPAKYSH